MSASTCLNRENVERGIAAASCSTLMYSGKSEVDNKGERHRPIYGPSQDRDECIYWFIHSYGPSGFGRF